MDAMDLGNLAICGNFMVVCVRGEPCHDDKIDYWGGKEFRERSERGQLVECMVCTGFWYRDVGGELGYCGKNLVSILLVIF